MYYLGQFEKSLLVWTKADRLRKNNKEVLFATLSKILNILKILKIQKIQKILKIL